MYGYDERYAQKYGLLQNRIGIVNQIHGCVYAHGSGNPLVLRKVRGCYVLYYFGDVIAQFFPNDCDGVSFAFSVVDSLSRALWLVRRAGCLVSVDTV